MKRSIIFCALIIAWSMAQAASFDCAKATSKAEKLICSDKGLSEQDEMLSMAYMEWLKSDSDKAAVKSRQIEWLKAVRNICADVACIQKAFDKRFEELSMRTRRNSDGSPVGFETHSDTAAALVSKKTIPAQFHGTWGEDKEACIQLKNGLNTDKIITIKANQLVGYAFACKFQSGAMKGSSFEGQFQCKDEEDGVTQKRRYGLSSNSQQQILLNFPGTKSPATALLSCEEVKASTIIQVRNNKTERSAQSANNTGIVKSQAPVVSCSAEDQIGTIDPRTGQMSQRLLDIQMGRVRCR